LLLRSVRIIVARAIGRRQFLKFFAHIFGNGD
jgi:hypothetical protein